MPVYADNPSLTTKDINRILHRQFGTRIHKGSISWNGQTIRLNDSAVEQLRRNYHASKGVTPTPHRTTGYKNPLPSKVDNRGSRSLPNPLANAGGSSDISREHELNGNMDLSVDNEETQRIKWRR